MAGSGVVLILQNVSASKTRSERPVLAVCGASLRPATLRARRLALGTAEQAAGLAFVLEDIASNRHLNGWPEKRGKWGRRRPRYRLVGLSSLHMLMECGFGIALRNF